MSCDFEKIQRTGGHKVEKHHPEGKNVRRTLHTKRKRQWYKNTRKKQKPTSPKKGKKEETRVAVGAPAYRRTIERRAVVSEKA